jgi:transposase
MSLPDQRKATGSCRLSCAPQTLNDWVKKAEFVFGKRPGVPGEMAIG